MKMKATVIQEHLAKALSYAIKAVSSTPSIPILSNVLIEFNNGLMKLSTTNLEVGIQTSIAAEMDNNGRTTVNAKMFSEFINSLPAGKLELLFESNKLIVKSEKNSADFNLIDAEEFPVLPKAEKKEHIKINALEFAKAIEKTAFSAATDNSRPVLTGLLLEATTKKMSLVGVDGFRLSKIVIDIEKNSIEKENEEFKYIVPAKALEELARIIKDLSNEKDSIELFLLSDRNQMVFKIKDLEFSTRLIEGEFPNYNEIIPVESKFKFSVVKEDFLQTVKIVSIFARSAIGNKAVFEIDSENNKVKLSARVADIGENESSCDISDVEGGNLKTAFNTKFLNDFLNVISGNKVFFETNGATAPSVFKDESNEGFIHIIMPMRLD